MFEEFAKKIKTKEELISYLEEISQAQQSAFEKKEDLLSEKVKENVS